MEEKKLRVLSPVLGKDGKTHWTTMGMGFKNKDDSINVYLDGLPVNGRLQVRPWEDPPWKKKDSEAMPTEQMGF